MPQNRIIRGFGYGVVATIVMSVLMVVALTSGMSPMPEPVPKAVVTTLVGSAPKPLVMALAVGLHLAYGGTFGALLVWGARPVTLLKGLGLGVALWLIMGVVFLPFVGWGAFGTAVTPRIAVATLVLHLVYGGVLGWAMDRDLPSVADGVASPSG